MPTAGADTRRERKGERIRGNAPSPRRPLGEHLVNGRIKGCGSRQRLNLVLSLVFGFCLT